MPPRMIDAVPIPVLMTPGHSAVTWMPRGASSALSASLIPTTQDVDGAVLVEDARGERLHGGRVADIEPVRHGGTDLVRDTLGALSVEVGAVDLRAELGEQPRGGPADPRAGAGDDGHRACELVRAVVHRRAPLLFAGQRTSEAITSSRWRAG